MKRGLLFLLMTFIIVTGLFTGLKINQLLFETYEDNETSPLGVTVNEENPKQLGREAKNQLKLDIEEEFRSSMFYTFGDLNRYHSVLDTQAVLGKKETFFIIRSKNEAYNQQVERFFTVSLDHFNKEADPVRRVHQIWLVDKDFTILKKQRVY
ncbi:hypothetical protein SAMN04488137_3360 [Fictibacillus solisalsi]|uniref:Uncharacterized protein n=1 Tax=Fictibacillus solisalsi TaxID=459525 RepID=A0A1G9YF09_9BACL|nr:hypothetical protein [Fictibacillus solisalsi]SDN07105.1 hypothetical protein SAMN04488137_3360 [Fictibacillus solisalsi]